MMRTESGRVWRRDRWTGGYGNETEKAMGSQVVHGGIFATTKGNGGGVIYDKSTKKICGELQGKVTITSGNTTTYCLSFSSAEKALNALGASITWNK